MSSGITPFASQLAEAESAQTLEDAMTPARSEAPAAALTASPIDDLLSSVVLPASSPVVPSTAPELPTVQLATNPASAPAAAAPAATPVSVAAPAAPGPVSVAWPVRKLAPTGATNVGTNGTEAGIRMALAYGFSVYSDPVGHGMTLNLEGRMFNQAVSAGYVPNSEEGLETFLAWQGAGFSAMPEGMKAFFSEGWLTG